MIYVEPLEPNRLSRFQLCACGKPATHAAFDVESGNRLSEGCEECMATVVKYADS